MHRDKSVHVVRTVARSARTRTHELTKDMVSKAELPLLSFSNFNTLTSNEDILLKAHYTIHDSTG